MMEFESEPNQSNTKKDSRGAGLRVAFLSLLLAFVLVEVVLRILELPSSNVVREIGWEGSLILDCYPTNPHGEFDIDLRNQSVRNHWEAATGQVLALIAQRTPFAVASRYNSRGLRGDEIPPRKSGIKRILVIGDSFTEGEGVKEQFTYPILLQRLLDSENPGKWEVLNGGRRGIDFPTIYENFLTFNDLEPDFILYGMVLNDAVRSAEFQERQKYLDDWIINRRGAGLEERMLFRGFRVAAIVHDSWERIRVARETTRWYRDMYGPMNEPGWEKTKSLIREMAERSRKQNAVFGIVLWPLLVKLDGHYPFEAAHLTIREFAEKEGIPFLDLLDTFRGENPEKLWVHPLDFHPNQLGHQLAANSILPFVRSLNKTKLPAQELK